MTNLRRWGVLGAVVVAAGALLAFGLPRIHVPEALDIGSPAPEFSARTVDAAGRLTALSSYRGNVVLLNVWATWCIPCQREMPSIERLYRELGPRGFRVVAVSIDDAGTESSIREFVAEYGLSFDILHDPTGTITRTYQMIGVPSSFLIDADGKIRKKTFETDWYSDENRALVADLLSRGS